MFDEGHFEMAKITFKDCYFGGGGIKIDGPVQIDATGNTFRNAETPFDLAPGTTGRIVDNRITDDPKLQPFYPQNSKRRENVSKGWRRPKGPPLPVYCSECEHIFASQNYVFAGPFFHCWGNKEECIVCGNENAELSEGVFNLSKATAEILRGPDITYEMLQRLSKLGENAIAGKLKPDELIKAATEIHPNLGALVKHWLSTTGYSIMLFFAVVGGVDATWSMVERVGKNVSILSAIKIAFETLQTSQDDATDDGEDDQNSGEQKPHQREFLDQVLPQKHDQDSDKSSSPEGVEPGHELPVPIPKPKPHG